jgi:hypothetical protein
MRLAMRLAAQGTPVVFASIFTADHTTRALGPTAHLVKPFPLYRLEQALAEALGPSAHAACA